MNAQASATALGTTNMSNEREQFLIRAAVTAVLRTACMPLSIAQITGALARQAPSVRLTMGEVKQAIFSLQRSGSVGRASGDGIARYVSKGDDDSTDPGIRIDGDALTVERARRAADDTAAARDQAIRRIERLIRLEAEHIVGYDPADDVEDDAHQQVRVDLTLDVMRKIARRSASGTAAGQTDDAARSASLRDDSRNRD
jgi:hypothetical protein